MLASSLEEETIANNQQNAEEREQSTSANQQQQQQHQQRQQLQTTLSINPPQHDQRSSIVVSPILYRPTLISTIAHHQFPPHPHPRHRHHHHHPYPHYHHRHHNNPHRHHQYPTQHPHNLHTPFFTHHNQRQRRHQSISANTPQNLLLANRFVAYSSTQQTAYSACITQFDTNNNQNNRNNNINNNNNNNNKNEASVAIIATTALTTTTSALIKVSPTASKLRQLHRQRLYGLTPTKHQIDIRYRRYFANRTYCDLISRCGNRGLEIDNCKSLARLDGLDHQKGHHTTYGDTRDGRDGGYYYHNYTEMLDILRSLRSLLKISRIHTDGNIFRLHYSLTVILLMAFCIIITTKQYVGEPIDCIRADGVDKSIINTYCWIHTTYSIPRAFNKKVGVDVPHPGVDNTNNPAEFQHHKYYQWVCFVLFVQAAFFYIPRYLWKLWESGKIEAVVMHLDVGVGFEPDLTLKKQAIVDYLYHSSGHHDWYAARYYFCECLSFVNVVAQMFLLDAFFEGEFFRYGLNVIEFTQLDQEERVDPMIKIFPRVTKCKFYKYGPSANIETIDALCLLPLNIINEKIYIFLWFWFIFLAILTFFMLIFGLIIIACPPVRVYMLNLRFRMSHLNHLHIIVRKSTIGDWFLLYLLGKNMDSYIFKDVIVDLAQRYMSKGKESDQRMLT